MSELSRRRFFVGAAGAAALAVSGCDRVISAAADLLDDPMPSKIDVPKTEALASAHHLLSRAAFGARPGDRARVVRIGKEAWIDEQLAPSTIDDTACALRTEVIDSIALPPSLLFEMPPEQLERELRRHTLLRAVHSRRQLEEVMVELWTDHFHVAIQKSLCRHLKTANDREVARGHALGRFGDLVRSSVTSPAMLVYLDGRENRRADGAATVNENHARELLELHTLGVHGGYTQTDVMEAARCLTGYVLDDGMSPGEARFVADRHDDGDKTVLGQRISGGGPGDVDKLVDVLVAHPSTARFVARKICVAFVDDDPPEAAIRDAASTFASSGGDIARVVRGVLLSDHFEASAGAKLKRPFRWIVSALRALGADTHAKDDFVFERLARMGQPLFSHPTPDGPPLEASKWLATFPARFAFALDLASDRIPGVRVPWSRLERALGDDPRSALAAHLTGGNLAPEAAATVERLPGAPFAPRSIALLLSSPAFARC